MAAIKDSKTENLNLIYEEVEVRRIETKKEGDKFVSVFKRLDTIRPKVKLRKEEADVLNFGPASDTRNYIFRVYLQPGKNLPNFIHAGERKDGTYEDGYFEDAKL